MTGIEAAAPYGSAEQRHPLPGHYAPSALPVGTPGGVGPTEKVRRTGVPPMAPMAQGAAHAPPSAVAAPPLQSGYPVQQGSQGGAYPSGPVTYPPFGTPLMPPGVVVIPPPAGTRVTLQKGHDSLDITIPSAGLCKSGGLAMIIVSIVWMAAVSAFPIIITMTPIPNAVALFSIPFYLAGIFILLGGISNARRKEALTIAGGQFTLRKEGLWTSVVTGACGSVSGVSLKVQRTHHHFDDSVHTTEGRGVTFCVIHEGVKEHQFGQFLTPIEQQWILGELARALNVPVIPMPCNV